jgi:hypothetical protein
MASAAKNPDDGAYLPSPAEIALEARRIRSRNRELTPEQFCIETIDKLDSLQELDRVHLALKVRRSDILSTRIFSDLDECNAQPPRMESDES